MLFIKFLSDFSLKTGSTCLEGSTCFDSYKSENALKFFTLGSITNALLTLKTNGLVEDTDYKLTD